jgi:4-hydroxybenzoyl-CoA thioesterase
MDKSAQSSASDSAGRIERPVVIRFSHIDAAGIMFYARYFELLSQVFPEYPIGGEAFAIKTEFRKSNRLGDKVQISFDGEDPAHTWSFSGRMDGHTHFAVLGLPSDVEQLAFDAHQPQMPAFCADPVTVEAWLTDHTGHMQVSRFFELVNSAVEQWFEELLGIRFSELHMNRRLGIPTVEMITRCNELPRLDDSVTILVRPVQIGKRALRFTSWLVRGAECLVENKQVIVFVRMVEDGFETVTIPDNIRARVAAQLAETGQGKS